MTVRDFAWTACRTVLPGAEPGRYLVEIDGICSMLRPAHVIDLPTLRALIREGAQAGSFEPALATESQEAAKFFTSLREALGSGYSVEPDPRTGDLATFAVLAYVYVPDDEPTTHGPIGFGIFKATQIGYELWLMGIDARWRGQGHGRQMLRALLDTPPGRKAYLVRVNNFGSESPAMAHLLAAFGYSSVRETIKFNWYLRRDAPEPLRAAYTGSMPVESTKAG
jgi:GNAT superfamily N-acetyltransferase